MIYIHQLINLFILMKTANGLFSYDQVYFNETLDTHANNVNRIVAKKCGWGGWKLNAGMFGYDNFIMSVGYALECPDKSNKETLCEYAHQGWATNYVFWRDNKPWLTNSFYKKPNKLPGDDRRDKLTVTKYANLPKEEKISNIIIAEYVLGLIHKQNKN